MNNNHNKKQEKAILFLLSMSLTAISAGLFATPISGANAETSNKTTITANVSPVISLSTSNIEVNLGAPTPTGTFASGSGTVAAATNDSNGYSIFLTSDSSSTTVLKHTDISSASINTLTSDQVIGGSKTMFDTMNTWGWSNDGVNYHSVLTKGTKNGSTSTGTTLFKKTQTPSVDNNTLTIGVTGNSTLVAGQYTGTLLLTAIPNSNTSELMNYTKTV